MAQNWTSSKEKERMWVKVEGRFMSSRWEFLEPESEAQDQRLMGSEDFEKQISDEIIHCSIFLKSELLYAILNLCYFQPKIGNNLTVHQWEYG